MGILDKIFGKKEKDKAKDPRFTQFLQLSSNNRILSKWCGDLYGSELARAAIDARARHISKLKIQVTGKAKPHLQTQLRLAPNEFQTWSQFMYRLSTILDLQNTAFIVPVNDSNGDTIGIYPILPQASDLVQFNGEPWLRYRFSSGEHAAIELRKVGILTKYQYESDFFGTDNGALNETMDLISIQAQATSEAAANSSTYQFMAQMTNFADPEDMAKERQRFTKENLSRDAKGGGLLLFPNTYKDVKQVEQSGYTPNTAQLEYTRTSIYNYFGVNDDILQNKAVGDTWNAFYEGCIEAFSIQFSEVVTRMLFTARERAQGNQVMATANRVQYMSNQDKLNASKELADRGILTLNEIRDIWNLEPVDGGDIRIARGEYYDVATGSKIGGTDPPDKPKDDEVKANG